mgnify:CR=1 FL=1
MISLQAKQVRSGFYSVADFSIARGYSAIDRRDGQRNVFVSADVDRSSVAPEEVSEAIRNQNIPSFTDDIPTSDGYSQVLY